MYDLYNSRVKVKPITNEQLARKIAKLENQNDVLHFLGLAG